MSDSDIDAIFSRIELLEEWKRGVEEIDKQEKLIGTKGLEERYKRFFNKAIDDCKDVNVAVRHFFRKLTHGDRTKILLSAGAVTVYISSDPVYYIDALEVMKTDSWKARKVFGYIFEAWSRYEAMVMVMGKTVVCGRCGQVVEVPPESWKRGEPGPCKTVLKEVNGRDEMSCPCGSLLGFLEGGNWIACRPGWSVKLDGLKKLKDEYPLLNGFECMVENIGEPVTVTYSKGATDCPFSEEQVESIIGWIEHADRLDHDDTGKHRNVCLPEPLALALIEHLRGLYGSR